MNEYDRVALYLTVGAFWFQFHGWFGVAAFTVCWILLGAAITDICNSWRGRS